MFCHVQNKPSKICQRVFKICLISEISPNLVTLVGLNSFFAKFSSSSKQAILTLAGFELKSPLN